MYSLHNLFLQSPIRIAAGVITLLQLLQAFEVIALTDVQTAAVTVAIVTVGGLFVNTQLGQTEAPESDVDA